MKRTPVLKELRQGRALTMAALAKKAKVTRTYISFLESGTRTNPSLAVLKRLAKALDVPVTELVA